MRALATFVVAAGVVAAFGAWVAAPAAAQDAATAYQTIKDLGDKKLDTRGKKPDEIRKEATDLFMGIIQRCEEFQKAFPGAAETGEVMYEEARAYFWLSRYSTTKKEHLAKGAEIAAKVVALDSKVEAAVKSRGLLIQYYKMTNRAEEMLAQARAIVADFPESADAPLALRYIAETCEGQRKDAEAVKAWEDLATKYPETTHGQRALGVLAFRKLKGGPLDVAFTAANGQAVDTKALKGKVVLLYFWSASDESSTSNLAFIAAAERVMREQGLAVIGVCLESNEETMKKACADAKAEWPEHFDGKKWDNEVAVKMGIRAIPMAILADRKGVVREIGLLGSPLIEVARQLLAEGGK